jgi:hypothetical protein
MSETPQGCNLNVHRSQRAIGMRHEDWLRLQRTHGNHDQRSSASRSWWRNIEPINNTSQDTRKRRSSLTLVVCTNANVACYNRQLTLRTSTKSPQEGLHLRWRSYVYWCIRTSICILCFYTYGTCTSLNSTLQLMFAYGIISRDAGGPKPSWHATPAPIFSSISACAECVANGIMAPKFEGKGALVHLGRPYMVSHVSVAKGQKIGITNTLLLHINSYDRS